jgi:hypothetical protein
MVNYTRAAELKLRVLRLVHLHFRNANEPDENFCGDSGATLALEPTPLSVLPTYEALTVPKAERTPLKARAASGGPDVTEQRRQSNVPLSQVGALGQQSSSRIPIE